MFDWPQKMKRYWPAIVLSLAIFLILDGTISSLETCHPPPNSPSAGQNGNENCTVLEGPFISLIIGIGNFVGNHDKGIVAAFTAILALSTIGLWTTTANLYRSAERQIRTSRQIAANQARQARQQFKFTKQIADRQAGEIRDQLKITRDGAAAAQKSADAAIATERARLYVVINHNFEGVVRSAMTWENTPTVDRRVMAATESPMATIKFKNYGKIRPHWRSGTRSHLF